MQKVRQNKANTAILNSAGAGLPTPNRPAELVCTFELSFKSLYSIPGLKKKKIRPTSQTSRGWITD